MAKGNQKARAEEQKKAKILLQYVEVEGEEGCRMSLNGFPDGEGDAFLLIDAIATQIKFAYRKKRNEAIEEYMKKKDGDVAEAPKEDSVVPPPPVEEPTE